MKFSFTAGKDTSIHGVMGSLGPDFLEISLLSQKLSIYDEFAVII